MSVSNKSTAADQTRAGYAGGLLGIGSIGGVTGKNIGVAVIDSGIAAHSALANKVVANVSKVTGDPAVSDVYGHGTHIAGIIAGQAGAAVGVTGLYTGGIAPGANLINVRVLGVNPDPVATERFEWLGRQRAAAEKGDPDRWREKFKHMPWGRPATSDEIAAAVVFLASDLSSYTSGTILTIDGGMVHRGGLL